MSLFKILVVLRNKTIESSETCMSLVSAKELLADRSEIILWDNSDVPLTSQKVDSYRKMLSGVNLSYIHRGRNVYLSEVYNNIIEYIDEDGLLLIFDHDSSIPISYFQELLEAINLYPEINLFLPRIYHKDFLFSPAKSFYFLGRHFHSLKAGVLSAKHLTAINSGMAIRCRYLKSEFPGYNTKIHFYGTDNDFMYKYSMTNRDAYVMDAIIQHHLNYFESTDVREKVFRFQDMKYGATEQMKEINWGVYMLCRLYFFLYQWRLAFKYKTLLPIKNVS